MKDFTPEERYQRLLEKVTNNDVWRLVCSSCGDWADYMQGPLFISDKMAVPCECGGTLDAFDVTPEYESLPPDGAPGRTE